MNSYLSRILSGVLALELVVLVQLLSIKPIEGWLLAAVTAYSISIPMLTLAVLIESMEVGREFIISCGSLALMIGFAGIWFSVMHIHLIPGIVFVVCTIICLLIFERFLKVAKADLTKPPEDS